MAGVEEILSALTLLMGVTLSALVVKAGAGMVVFADTIGVASPCDIRRVLKAVKAEIGDHPIDLHLHNARSTGYASAIAGLEEGVSLLDFSIGGLGGLSFCASCNRISDRLDLWFDEKVFTVGSGDSVRIRNEPYRWATPYTKPAVALWVIAPPVY